MKIFIVDKMETKQRASLNSDSGKNKHKESAVLQTFYNLYRLVFLIPFRITLDPVTGKYRLESNVSQKVNS